MRTRRVPLTARTADKYDLYQRSVQSPDVDVSFMARLFRRLNGRPLRFLREDFCGTFAICCEFVKRCRKNRALGVDLDRRTLEWGRARNLARLSPDQRRRVLLMRKNVLDVRRPRVDLVCAMNFSYWVFKTRQELRTYMRNARRSLRPGGILLLDVYGGGQAMEERQEESKKGGFLYIWDQARFDPVTHQTLCKIHFAFKDGTRLRNAFLYDWRVWTLPELRELMEEAGLKDVHVLWEGTDRKTEEGNGVYRRAAHGKADPSWIVYVVGRA
ncbi:MAG: class I SAM-dependent methyltransferase [Acidobacteriota bacterium]